jgi:hypothetical protein
MCKQKESQQVCWLSFFVEWWVSDPSRANGAGRPSWSPWRPDAQVSMNNNPRQPQPINDRQYTHQGERLSQPLFGTIGNAEIQHNRAHT